MRKGATVCTAAAGRWTGGRSAWSGSCKIPERPTVDYASRKGSSSQWNRLRGQIFVTRKSRTRPPRKLGAAKIYYVPTSLSFTTFTLEYSTLAPQVATTAVRSVLSQARCGCPLIEPSLFCSAPTWQAFYTKEDRRSSGLLSVR